MHLQSHFNPFALMVHPETVLQAMEGSVRLQQLQRRICRPLDKAAPEADAAQAEGGDAYDQSLDAELAEYPDLFRT